MVTPIGQHHAERSYSIGELHDYAVAHGHANEATSLRRYLFLSEPLTKHPSKAWEEVLRQRGAR